MSIKLIISIFGGVIYFGLIGSIFLRSKFVALNAGKQLMKLPGEVSLKSIVIFVVAAALIAIVPLRNFAPYLNVIFVAAALIATEMAAREMMVSKNAGVYEKKILYGAYSYFYDEIELLPTLAWEDDPETTQVDKRFLKIILKNGTQVEFGFETEEMRNQAVQLMIQQAPRLKE
ncbi:MAG: hypothetical protein KBT11_02670 [Treponema sp.]|nr:hypothetical protein [Candidatus Treponema equifaecale]